MRLRVPGAVRLESGQLAVQVAAVLHLGVGHVDDAPDSLISGVKPDEHRDQFAHIQVVGLGPPSAAVHFNAGGVHHIVLHAVSGQVAVEPEAIPPGLVATEDAGIFGKAEPLLGQGDFPLQGGEIASGDGALPGGLSQPDGEGQTPLLFAQFKGQV